VHSSKPRPRSDKENADKRAVALAAGKASPAKPLLSLAERMAADEEEEDFESFPAPPKKKSKRAVVELSEDEKEKEEERRAAKRRRKGSSSPPRSSANSAFPDLISDEEDEILRKGTSSFSPSFSSSSPSPPNAVEKIDYASLCPFCNEPMPPKPSSYLLDLKEYLVSRPEARRNDASLNKFAVQLPISQTAAFCKRHKQEKDVIPEGIKEGWPQELDWVEVDKFVCFPPLPVLPSFVLLITRPPLLSHLRLQAHRSRMRRSSQRYHLEEDRESVLPTSGRRLRR
jgi:hypothetical protein